MIRSLAFTTLVMCQLFRVVFIFLLACFVALAATATATAGGSVAILGSPFDPAWNNDVQAKLLSTGLFSGVDIVDIGFVTPSLAQLSTYDSVLVYSDRPYQDAVTLGDNLADYVDAGGGVVVAVFANASIPFGGRFNTDNYWGIIPGPQIQLTPLTLGTIHDPGSPLLDGVTAFDGGSASYRSTGVLHPSAVSVADWSDGSPLIVTRTINGTPRVDLNFHPPSSDARFDFWLANTDGARLMANALLFTTGPPDNVVTHYFTGTIMSVSGTPFGLSPSIGQQVQGSFTYDTSQPPAFDTGTVAGYIQPPPSGMSVVISSITLQSQGNASLQVINDDFGPVDNINGFFTPISVGGVSQSNSSSISFSLSDFTLTALSSTALPLSLDVASFSQRGGSVFDAASGGSLNFSIDTLSLTPPPPPPPDNDDFTNAALISALPFDDTVNTTSASLETDEPTSSCVFPSQSNTVWYAFIPTESGSISASLNAPFPIVVAVYTGDSLADLTEVNCNFARMTFQVEAGMTYYFQVGSLFDLSGPLQFTLDVTPPPVASFSFFPFDPSVFDSIQFIDQSFDPEGGSIQSQVWDFGDGATATGCCPTHRYAADGDYTVQLTVTTFDGRTASTSQTVQVRTHDVAITKFSAPQAASAGQTRHLSVGINSKRYPETIQIDLFKSVPGGFEFVGSLVQSVPVRSGNRTTDFDFSYTFTSGDASIGKVTFKSFATVLGARDALPADNEAVASPTKVNFPAHRQFTDFTR